MALGNHWKGRIWPLFAWILLSWVLGVGVVEAADLPETLADVKPSVVGVGTWMPARQPSAQFRGTGFAVANGHYILTNLHVLPEQLNPSRKEQLVVFLGRGKDLQARHTRRVASDQVHDLALLRIAGHPLPALQLGDSRGVRAGELFAFTGFPLGMVLGLYPATHRGIVSAISPIALPTRSSKDLNPQLIKRLSQPYKVFQLDATAYPGNSGSPLYYPQSGRVVGIVNKVFVKESKEAILEKPSGITYAIPIQYARRLLRKAGVLD